MNEFWCEPFAGWLERNDVDNLFRERFGEKVAILRIMPVFV